jgi:hypothetical protein
MREHAAGRVRRWRGRRVPFCRVWSQAGAARVALCRMERGGACRMRVSVYRHWLYRAWGNAFRATNVAASAPQP